MQRDIIIINYHFIENKVGGNRWRNLSSHLNQQGNRIFILCQTPQNKFSPLSFGPKIIERNNTLNWLKTRKSLPFHGLIYRFTQLMSSVLYGGNFFDVSYLTGKKHARYIKESLVNKRIKSNCLIICSVGPFTYVHEILKLKKQFSEVKIVLDYRDPWSTNSLSFGFNQLNKLRKDFEKKNEILALNSCDGIIGVSKEIYYPLIVANNISTPNCEIPNGIDVIKKNKPIVENNGKVKIFLAGTLYNDLDDLTTTFFEDLRNIRLNNPKLLEQFEWHWIGEYSESQKKMIDHSLHNHAIFHGKLSQNELQSKIEAFHVGLNILHRDFSYSKNTKFYEVLSHQKKILLISWPGDTSNYINKNSLGYTWHPGNSTIDLLQTIKSEFDTGNLIFKSHQNKEIQNLTFECQSVKLTKFVDSLYNV